ncbi:MAG: glycosyltransferase, partial [Dehalococcoidales bacterium]|nr:glycosyltransferase [Dehalococcoidales bacterium]
MPNLIVVNRRRAWARWSGPGAMLILAAVVHVAFAWLLSLYRGWRARCPVPETAGEADRPPVSILVPAWQERGTAERCITSLRRLRYPRWEAVIIAGGSDGTYEATLRAT